MIVDAIRHITVGKELLLVRVLIGGGTVTSLTMYHRPKSPFCEVCSSVKVYSRHARRADRNAEKEKIIDKLCQWVLADHFLLQDEFKGENDEKGAVLQFGVGARWRYFKRAKGKPSEFTKEAIKGNAGWNTLYLSVSD